MDDVVIFSNQAGRVVAFTDPGLPAVTAVRLTNFGGYTTMRSIITRCGFSGQANVNFRHTIGGAVHLYTFGDKIGRGVVSGLCFDSGCEDNAFDGLARIINYYDRNRVSERGNPVLLTIGAALSLRAYLMGVTCDVADTTSRLYQFTFDLVLIPVPPRREDTSRRDASRETAAARRQSIEDKRDAQKLVGIPDYSTDAAGDNPELINNLPGLTPDSVSGGDISGGTGLPVNIPYDPTPGWASVNTGPRTGLTVGFD